MVAQFGTFLQQLECGYEFPALIHVWIASAGVLEWFTSTSGLTRQLGNIHTTISRGRELVGMNGVSIYIPFLGKIDSYTYLIKTYTNTNKPSLVLEN